MRRPTPATLIFLAALACASPLACDWLLGGQDNPHDQQRCEPSCDPGQVCFNGACKTSAADAAGDSTLPVDQKVTDGFSGPACRTPCSTGKICDDNCWCWENPLSGRRQLNAIVGFQNFAIAVGEKGTVLRLDHNGWTASRISDKDLLAVWALGPTLIYAVGESGTVFRYENGKWSLISNDAMGEKDLRGVWGTSVSDVHIVGEKGKVLHYDGVKWEAMTEGTSTSASFRAVWGRGTTEAYAVGDSCWVSQWNGKGWKWLQTEIPSGCSGRLNSVWVGGPGEVWAVGDSGAVLRRTQGKWSTPAASFTTKTLTHVWGHPGGSVVWATTSDGKVFKFDGTQWAEAYDGASDIVTDKQLNGVWGSSGSDIYAVGNVGKVVHFNGTRWRAELPGITDAIHGVWVTAKGDAFAVGYQGRLLVRDKKRWREKTPASLTKEAADGYASLQRVWGTSPSNIYAVGHRHVLRFDGSKWEDLAKTWGITKQIEGYVKNTSDFVYWWGIWGLSASDIWISGGGYSPPRMKGLLAHYNGKSWTLHTPPGKEVWPNISTVWGSSPDETFAVGLQGLFIKRSGGTWKTISGPGMTYGSWNLHGIWGAGPTMVFATGKLAHDPLDPYYKGVVFRYDGASFAKSGAEVPKVHLDAIWGSGPNEAYVVGDSFNIRRFDGKTWSSVAAGSVSDNRGELFSVGTHKAGDVTVVGKYGTIYRRCGK